MNCYDFLSCVKSINHEIDFMMKVYQDVREPLIEYCGMEEGICDFCSYVFTPKNDKIRRAIFALLVKLGYSMEVKDTILSVEKFISECIFGDRKVEIQYYNGDYIIKEGKKNMSMEEVLSVVIQYSQQKKEM